MNFFLRFTYIIGLIIGVTSCQQTLRDITRDAVLEVEGEILYQDEIEDFIPEGLAPQDSLYLAESYKKQWITQTLLYKIAYKNIGNSREIKQLTESYRKTLIVNQFQQQLITERLDEISEDSLLQYYEQNKNLFPLEEAVIKGIFIKVPSNETDSEELLTWLNNTTDHHLENIMRYCTQHAVSHQFFLEAWTPYSKINMLLPESIDANDPMLTRGAVVQKREDYTYYLRITGICPAGNPQPYEMIRPNLNGILLNQEKIKFINQFQQTLYNDAIQNGSITFFDNE